MEEFHYHQDCSFVTLTFSEENLLKYRLLAQEELKDETKCDIYLTDNTAAKIAIRHYLERVRKRTGKSIKHWFITERGHKNTRRVHVHGIIWASYSQRGRGSNKPGDLDLTKEWKNGWTFNGDYVGEKTITYVSKYITKNDKDNKGYKGKICCSPGIGKKYILSYNGLRNRFKGKKTIETYRLSNGKEIGLPMYYRNKIYSDAERERLWMQLLDKEERWVLGKRIDISNNGIWKWDNAAEEGRRISKNAGYQIPDFTTDEWKKEYFKKQKLLNYTKSCIFANRNINTSITNHERSKSKLRHLQMHETLAEHSNVGHRDNNGNHGILQKADELAWLRLRNYRNTRAGETNGENPDIQTERNKASIIDNINIYKNGNAGTNNTEKQLAQGSRNMPQGSGNVGKALPRTENGMLQENERKSIEMLENSNRTGYKVIDIDTGEIYTKVEYTRIKNQLKTISYDKKSRKGTRADGSRYTWYETKRFVQKVGKDQLEMEF